MRFSNKKPLRATVFCSLAVAGVLGLSAVTISANAWAEQTASTSEDGLAKVKANASNPVEMRIKELHDKLQVTEAQAGQWEAVARTMRNNAQVIEQLVQERHKNAPKMTAVEDLRAYQEITEAHAKGARRLGDAFETLYGTMSPDQKALADAVFRQHKQDATSASR